MLIKIDFGDISSLRREGDVNQCSLRNRPEERSSQERDFSILACVVETEMCVTKKQAFAKRHIIYYYCG